MAVAVAVLSRCPKLVNHQLGYSKDFVRVKLAISLAAF